MHIPKGDVNEINGLALVDKPIKAKRIFDTDTYPRIHLVLQKTFSHATEQIERAVLKVRYRRTHLSARAAIIMESMPPEYSIAMRWASAGTGWTRRLTVGGHHVNHGSILVGSGLALLSIAKRVADSTISWCIYLIRQRV